MATLDDFATRLINDPDIEEVGLHRVGHRVRALRRRRIVLQLLTALAVTTTLMVLGAQAKTALWQSGLLFWH